MSCIVEIQWKWFRWCQSVLIICPHCYPVLDWATNHPLLCSAAPVKYFTSIYSYVAFHWWCSYQWVYYRGLLLLCLFNALSHWAADFLGLRQNQVTIGNYFKHLVMYGVDRHFAKHTWFCFFTLNTEMHWRALQTSWIYVRQHPNDAQLTLDDLPGMVECVGEAFSNHVWHRGASFRGTKQYWFRQCSWLMSMIDTLGLHTIFFTHSAADLQWLASTHHLPCRSSVKI